MGARGAAAGVGAKVGAVAVREGTQAGARLAVRAEVRAKEVSAGAIEPRPRQVRATSHEALHVRARGLPIVRAVAAYRQIAWRQTRTRQVELPLYNIRGM